jgi:hypothetical protein
MKSQLLQDCVAVCGELEERFDMQIGRLHLKVSGLCVTPLLSHCQTNLNRLQ